MSSQPPSGGPSARPEGPGEGADERGLAAQARSRGAALIDALEEHLPGARDHADASGAYAFACAVELGCDRGRAELVREVARLHEVGMVYVPAELAGRDRAGLTDEERAAVDASHESGYRLAHGAAIPDRVCEAILGCGDRHDGGGVTGAAADTISLEARIARAGCVCHRALSADPARGERRSDRRDAAVAGLRRRSGGELDPRVVDAMVAVLSRAAGGAG